MFIPYQGKSVGTQILDFIKKQLKNTDRGYPAKYFYLNNGFEPSDSSILLHGDTSSDG